MNRRAFILAVPLIAAGAIQNSPPKPEVTIQRQSYKAWLVYWTDAEGWHTETRATCAEALNVARRVLLRDAA